MNKFKAILMTFSLLCATLVHAADVRFDAHYFFQSESEMRAKELRFDELARYSRLVQGRVWKALQKAKLPVSRGYLVLAFDAKGKATIWTDMQPEMDAYYDNAIYDAIKTIIPPPINEGIVVFAMKMSINTPIFTTSGKPKPLEWDEARKQVSDPDNIEAIARAAWPED